MPSSKMAKMRVDEEGAVAVEDKRLGIVRFGLAVVGMWLHLINIENPVEGLSDLDDLAGIQKSIRNSNCCKQIRHQNLISRS